jgi:hypothetical protein
MIELEKLSDQVLNGPPIEAYQPITITSTEQRWEDEDWSEERDIIEIANKVLDSDNIRNKYAIIYAGDVIDNLKRIGRQLVDKSDIKAA